VDRGNRRVRFAPELIEANVAQAPAKFTMYARNPKRNLRFGTNFINFGCVGTPAYCACLPQTAFANRSVHRCPWRIGIHAATGSSKRPPQCFSQVKLRSVAGCVTTLPHLSAGVSPSSDACVREWLK
jgi:hypothetical protein